MIASCVFTTTGIERALRHAGRTELRLPRIADRYLNCIVYIYPSPQEAHVGESVGGTGFLVGAPIPGEDQRFFLYVVTCAHVVRRGGHFIRVNNKDEGFTIYGSKPEDWTFHPDGDDIAACYIGLEQAKHGHAFVIESLFALPRDQWGEQVHYALGDDVFFLGRFVTHEGKQRNTPTIRFGNLSALSEEPIRREDGVMQESFLVEARSLPGYSGSPVFVYPTVPLPTLGYSEGARLRLLGIDWCHLRTFRPVLDADRRPVDAAWVVEQNSGMMGVVPAWKIIDLLREPEMEEKREEMARKMRERASHVAVDSVSEGEGEFERFERLTRELVEIPKPKGDKNPDGTRD